jgi:uncharacterized protein YndB with AHSA1/START domain
MHRRLGVLLRISLLAFGTTSLVPAYGQTPQVSKQALVTIDAAAEVNATVDKVWAALTETDMAHSWYPGWKRQNAGEMTAVIRVGEQIPFDDGWGNSGQSVVLFVDPHHELRIAHVPDNGTYLCQVKVRLTARAGKTLVEVTEQYSDDIDVPLDKDTAEMTRQEVAKYLAVLKKLAEGQAVEERTGADEGLLDGQTFLGEIGEKSKNAFASEELYFANGMFRSSRCDQYNFGEASYTAAKKGDAIVFEAEAISPSDGKMKWKGTVDGASIDAAVEWYDKTGKLVTLYWVKGKLIR